jgi:hypothetical protein
MASVVLFPFAALTLLSWFRIPCQSREADFVALIPQGLFAPSVFHLIRKRFLREDNEGH